MLAPLGVWLKRLLEGDGGAVEGKEIRRFFHCLTGERKFLEIVGYIANRPEWWRGRRSCNSSVLIFSLGGGGG